MFNVFYQEKDMAVCDRLNPYQSIYESELRDNIIRFGKVLLGS